MVGKIVELVDDEGMVFDGFISRKKMSILIDLEKLADLQLTQHDAEELRTAIIQEITDQIIALGRRGTTGGS